jgi:hypothetical protein
VSGYYVALEIRQAYDVMSVAIPAGDWDWFGRATAEEVAAWLRRVVSRVDGRPYQKHPRWPKKQPPAKAVYTNGEHVSTARLLRQWKPLRCKGCPSGGCTMRGHIQSLGLIT